MPESIFRICYIDNSVTPVKLATRKVPVALKDKIKNELDTLVEKDIISQVDVPTDWISSMVVVTKSSGKIRLCIDPKLLNSTLNTFIFSFRIYSRNIVVVNVNFVHSD
jgi:hypothetical protein